MQHLETYLRELRLIHSSGVGVPETSYYPALATLLNDIGNDEDVQPHVHCIMHPSNSGGGLPDGGLFSSDQLRNESAHDPDFVVPPSRGVIEVKPTSEDIDEIAASGQVQGYLQHYGQVLVTNLRSFLLLGLNDHGEPEPMERFDLAADERSFWNAARSPRQLARQHGDRLTEFLKRVMLRPVALRDPKDVAWFLASYARDARSRIENVELGALSSLRAALEEALGLRFTDVLGDHFFRSTLIQTLFYGVFSAWVLWHREKPRAATEHFDWRTAEWSLHVPMIRTLFHQIASPQYLEPLKLVEVLNWTAAALNRVDTATFFERFQEEHAVQYFYEPFLEAFDPELRKQLGVWYTPPEIVTYMVERVDRVLREVLDVPDGLADPSVYVLDPATGTGSYLVEILKRIDATLRERGADALSAHRVKQAALERVFGFEILPAPFVVAHLQLGLFLRKLGAPLNERERAGVYLTNSLTGWRPPNGQQPPLAIPELQAERDAAEHVKRDTPILVVIGNPPYSGFAGIAVDEERELTDIYRKAKRTRQPKGQGLNDLYLRFFGMADRKIVEDTGRGIICYISNYSWLEGLSFTAMRERYLQVFDRIWIDNLNGDKYKTGKVTPWGEPDPSVFSTDWNREGIQVGTAVALLARTGANEGTGAVEYREFWGRAKREALLASLQQDNQPGYERVEPELDLGLPFIPLRSAPNYVSWPRLADLLPVSFPGVKTSRDNLLVDIDRGALEQRMELYFDASVSNDELRRQLPEAMTPASGFDPVTTRKQLLERGFLPRNVVLYCYRPFDLRWLYWEPETRLLDRNRTDYFPHVVPHNLWIAAVAHNRKGYDPPVVTSDLGSLHLIERGANMYPVYLARKKGPDQLQLFGSSDADAFSNSKPLYPNLSPDALDYIHEMNATPMALGFHIIAVLYSAAYRAENAGALRLDWPRIPLPASSIDLTASSALGEQISRLVDPRKSVIGVTQGQIRAELQAIGVPSTTDGRPINPTAGDLDVDANWGYRGRGGAIMPAKGRAEPRDYSDEERAAIERGAAALGLDPDVALAKLGATTVDVYVNDRVYWRNVPENVWEYTLGGYQVIKKWLSYRERDVLGRALTLDEVEEVTNIARRIAAILLLEPALDANYQAVKAAAYEWPGST